MKEQTSHCWYAITTRYKCEKHVAERLCRKGIEVYVPLLTRTKRYTRKIKTYQIPLISCYVFVRIDRKHLVRVLETTHVVDVLRFNGEIARVRDHEIELLKRIVGEVKELSAEPKTWLKGDRVEIISGGLTGIQGILVERQGRHEFVVELDTLGYHMCMTIDMHMLRRLDVLEHA
ncbi:MAG: UpxY family transcription antiterminator [Saprospiraceae bacterium]|nr:UpxY family transcription antiterminator [Saprospiraceae bacterium]